MLVLKFGGTSVADQAAIRRLVQIVRATREHHAVLMPPLLTGVDGHPDLLLGDGRHPNADGYTIIVGNLLKIIEPYLKKDSGV